MRIGVIVQARANSTRLPRKMLADLGGRPVLWHTLQRIKTLGNPVIVAIPEHDPTDLIEIANRCQCAVSLGDEQDVLARYYYAAQGFALDWVVRVCGDQPLLDPAVCGLVITAIRTGLFDWVANDVKPSYPIGLGCEIFTFAALELAHKEATKPHDREHVSPFIMRDRRFTGLNLRCPINGISDLRLTIDTEEDLEFIRKIDQAQPKDYSLKSTLEAIERVKNQNIAA